MPRYDYACSACGVVTEVIHGIHDAMPRSCPACGADGTLRKAIAAPTVHYRGSGWAKKDRSATSTPGKAKARTEADGSGQAAAGDTGAGRDTSAGRETASRAADATAPATTSTTPGSGTGGGE